MDLEAFELVLLRRPENPVDYDDAELERIQQEHLAHHARLRASGQVVTNGPVIEPPDPSLRGLTFYRTGSLEEARRLAEADPSVRAGRLAVEIMTWYCPPGTMSKPGRAVTVLEPGQVASCPGRGPVSPCGWPAGHLRAHEACDARCAPGLPARRPGPGLMGRIRPPGRI